VTPFTILFYLTGGFFLTSEYLKTLLTVLGIIIGFSGVAIGVVASLSREAIGDVKTELKDLTDSLEELRTSPRRNDPEFWYERFGLKKGHAVSDAWDKITDQVMLAFLEYKLKDKIDNARKQRREWEKKRSIASKQVIPMLFFLVLSLSFSLMHLLLIEGDISLVLLHTFVLGELELLTFGIGIGLLLRILANILKPLESE